MKKKALLLECASGISGDMMLGALLDMGADREGLMHLIGSLPIDGYRIHQGETKKKGSGHHIFMWICMKNIRIRITTSKSMNIITTIMSREFIRICIARWRRFVQFWSRWKLQMR